MKSPRALTERDFRLLLTFLGDKSDRARELARHQIRTALDQRPSFRRTIERIEDPEVRSRAQWLAESLWFDKTAPAFRALMAQGDALDLERALMLFATIERPSADFAAVRTTLDEMAAEIDRQIAAEPPLPTRPIQALRRRLFVELNFRVDTAHANEPRNQFLDEVLKRRRGHPMALAAIYLLLSWRLNLLVHPIGLPGHVIVGHRAPRGVVLVDPSQRGRLLRRKDCEVLVRRRGYSFREDHLDPISNRELAVRIAAHLVSVYAEEGATARAHWLAEALQILQRGETAA